MKSSPEIVCNMFSFFQFFFSFSSVQSHAQGFGKLICYCELLFSAFILVAWHIWSLVRITFFYHRLPHPLSPFRLLVFVCCSCDLKKFLRLFDVIYYGCKEFYKWYEIDIDLNEYTLLLAKVKLLTDHFCLWIFVPVICIVIKIDDCLLFHFEQKNETTSNFDELVKRDCFFQINLSKYPLRYY